MSQQLPIRPNLDHLKKQAKDVLRVFRRQKPRWRLADAQRAVARGYGFSNWPSLKAHVEKTRHQERTQPGDSAAANPSRKSAGSNGGSASIHPIAGAWVADHVIPAQGDPQYPIDGVALEFQINAEEMKLTQLATDTTGREMAVTTTICPDGHEHPVPFGNGVRLKALWTTSLKLDAVFTKGEGIIDRWSYEVSPDGSSLIISTSTDRLVFRRP
jgi:hypothetical protein